MPLADPAFLFSIGHIRDPMQGILDAPMVAHSTGNGLHIERQGTDVVAPLHGDLRPDVPLRLGHPDSFQSLLLRSAAQVIQMCALPITTHLDPPMIRFDILMIGMGTLRRMMRPNRLKELHDFLMQHPLSVLDR